MTTDFTDPTQHGVFDTSPALHHVYEISTAQHPDYLQLTRSCEVCLTPKKCLVPWSEVYCLAHNVPPHKVGEAIQRPDLFPTVWSYLPRGKCYHPNYKCTCSNHPYVVFNLTPTECDRLIRLAAKNGVMSDQQKGMIKQIHGFVKRLSGG